MEVCSVKGGLGGEESLAAEAEDLSLEEPTSVVGGVRTFGPGCGGGGATASRLCCLEKVGYGRLDFDSECKGEGASSRTAGMEGRLVAEEGERDVLDEVLSLLEEVRCVEGL